MACLIRCNDSLLVLAGIPFAIGGGILALCLTGLDFSISAAIGFVSLFGVSVMNGILVISYFNHAALDGHAGPGSDVRGRREADAPDADDRPVGVYGSAAGGFLDAVSAARSSVRLRPSLSAGMLLGPIMLLIVVPAMQLLFLGNDQPGAVPPEAPDLTPPFSGGAPPLPSDEV